MSFAHPWLLLAAPLPLVVYWLLPPMRQSTHGALRIPFFQQAASLARGAQYGARRWILAILQACAWLFLVLAAANPQLHGKAIAIPTEGRDLMLAIDISGSMEREDFSTRDELVDRLTVVREVAKDFIAQREGDRVGLILFGTRAYLQTPLTPDLKSVGAMLDEAEIGLAGDKTAIGDAIGVAVKSLRERPAQERVLVLLSDGASNSGALEPLQAAKLAKKAGIRIHTVGVGADRMAVQTMFGPQIVNPSEDLDEKTLSEVAKMTGGQFFRAKDGKGLAEIYRQIQALEPTAGEAAYLRPTRSLFYWPLAGALLLSMVVAVMRLALLPMAKMREAI